MAHICVIEIFYNLFTLPMIAYILFQLNPPEVVGKVDTLENFLKFKTVMAFRAFVYYMLVCLTEILAVNRCDALVGFLDYFTRFFPKNKIFEVPKNFVFFKF